MSWKYFCKVNLLSFYTKNFKNLNQIQLQEIINKFPNDIIVIGKSKKDNNIFNNEAIIYHYNKDINISPEFLIRNFNTIPKLYGIDPLEDFDINIINRFNSKSI